MKFRSRLVVNLKNLDRNIQYIKQSSPNSKMIFMVKADAYGHGFTSIVRYVFTKLGINEFGCASIEEAKQLRSALPELKFDIFVFSDLQLENPENVEIYSNKRIFPVLANIDQLNFFLHQESFKYFPICLKFNTGMNRLGIEMSKLHEVIKLLKQHGRNSVYHLFTHLSNSTFSMTDDEKNLAQVNKHLEIETEFRTNNIIVENTSLANSGAIMQKSGFDKTHIRPGIMIYTYPNCISKLETTILHIFSAKQGMPVGYNSTPCPRDGVIAVIAIGYGDGFSTHYSGAHIQHQGMDGEIIGRINMDMTFVLFPLDADKKINVGDTVAIWGENEGDLLKFSNETKTITYELLCSLLPRIPRIYRLS
jgi:alanine racemase